VTNSTARVVVLTVAVLLTSGCWNGYNHSIDLGAVSIGQQMIDLKTALEQQAITQQEYDRLKQALMVIDGSCEQEEV
jgi:hypothetical protein